MFHSFQNGTYINWEESNEENINKKKIIDITMLIY